ncbi:MAG: hypothetical protein GY934_15825, partial [Gammaproteobacteria bacterium]|nr:hypothetical protein [Gammaproteobacteria bacterium]
MSTGWYIDNVEITHQVKPVLAALEDFESGWEGWYSDRGIWQVGEATSGPGSCYGGAGQCAGTILGGNYPTIADSRLISPEIDLPTATAGEEVVLRFREYWTYQSADQGEIQISVYEAGTWTDWTILDTRPIWSSVWQHGRVDLSAYAGQRVRVAFYHMEYYEDQSGIWSSSVST